MAGVHLETGSDVLGSDSRTLVSGTKAFSAPITLDVGCGVARWSSNENGEGRSTSSEVCGFADVNGDGLVDRLRNGGVAHWDGRSERAIFQRLHPVARACRPIGIHFGGDRRTGSLSTSWMPGAERRAVFPLPKRDLPDPAHQWLARHQWRIPIISSSIGTTP